MITFRLDLISIMVNIERILLKLFRVKKLSQWWGVLFCLLLPQFKFKSYDLRLILKPRCYTITYIIYRLLTNFLDLFYFNLCKTAKHWDSFLTHCIYTVKFKSVDIDYWRIAQVCTLFLFSFVISLPLVVRQCKLVCSKYSM